MALLSHLLSPCTRLQDCLISDAAHLVPGDQGDPVGRIQISLGAIDALKIDPGELSDKRYGPSTAAAVLAFKIRRGIINRGYQTKPDNIVGKMTIAALDAALLKLQVSNVRRSRPAIFGLTRPRSAAELRAEAMVRLMLAKPGLRPPSARATANLPGSSPLRFKR